MSKPTPIGHIGRVGAIVNGNDLPRRLQFGVDHLALEIEANLRSTTVPLVEEGSCKDAHPLRGTSAYYSREDTEEG